MTPVDRRSGPPARRRRSTPNAAARIQSREGGRLRPRRLAGRDDLP